MILQKQHKNYDRTMYNTIRLDSRNLRITYWHTMTLHLSLIDNKPLSLANNKYYNETIICNYYRFDLRYIHMYIIWNMYVFDEYSLFLEAPAPDRLRIVTEENHKNWWITSI